MSVGSVVIAPLSFLILIFCAFSLFCFLSHITGFLSNVYAFFSFLFFFLFWPCQMACGILVLRPGIDTPPAAVKAWSLNHWTAREVPPPLFFLSYCTKTFSMMLSRNAGRGKPALLSILGEGIQCLTIKYDVSWLKKFF